MSSASSGEMSDGAGGELADLRAHRLICGDHERSKLLREA